jgi:predicted ester cyclase
MLRRNESRSRRTSIYSAVGVVFVLFAVAFEPAFAQQTDQERNREAFLRIVNEAFNAGNVDVLSEILAPEFVSHSPNGDNNRDISMAIITAYHTAMPDLVLTPQVVVADGDFVAGVILFEGTFSNPLAMPDGALSPTGQRVRFVMQSVHRFNQNGQSVEEWLSWDNLSVLTQLGALQTGDTPSSSEYAAPELVIRRFYDYFSAGNRDAQDALWADDATLTLPDGTLLEGREQVISFRPDHKQIVISDLEVDGNTVRWTSTADGEPFFLEAVVENGKIHSMRFR